MSIVEGVAQANREGWQTHKASSRSQPQNWSPGLAGGLEVPKAPRRVTRDDLDAVFPGGNVSATPPIATMVLPRAPGSVIPPPTTTGMTATATAARTPPAVIAGGGSGIGPSASTSSGAMKSSSTSSLGPPRPLKSALRSSRTPSPNPLPHARGSVDLTPFQDRSDASERVGRSTSVKTADSASKEKDTDEASISSYETGHENPDEEDDDTPPTPPPHDDHHPAASDLSASTASTQTPTATATPAARRKSVRVSLQPTFSPTPPALDDDDETRAPWSDGEDSTWGRKRGAVDGDEERDMWQDSSEEDEEYRRARRLLARVGKKKKSRQ